MTDDLIARLRSKGEWTSDKVWESDPDCKDAADALEAKDKRVAWLERRDKEWQELHGRTAVCREAYNAAKARIAALEAALKPFADRAKAIDEEYAERCELDCGEVATYLFAMGDLRAARAAMEGKDV